MIHLKKETVSKDIRVVKCTKDLTMHVSKSGIELDQVDILNEEWYRKQGYIDATREEFDEQLKKLAETINQITKE